MDKIITHENNTYIILPKDTTLLYAEFNDGESFKLRDDLEFRVKTITCRRLDILNYFDGRYSGNRGQLLFRVSHQFYRRKLNPNEARKDSKGLKKYLGEDSGINTSDESVSRVAQEIISQLPQAHRENPYAITEGIIHWIKDNIEYTIVPKKLIKHVAKIISYLPQNERIDVYKILRYNILRDDFDFSNDTLERIAEDVHLTESLKEVSDYEIAKELMNKVGKLGFFQKYWIREEGELSAKKTLEERASKCVGISHLFVALSRNLGIPSRELYGCLRNNENDGGGHSWATSYIHPFGWVEIAPIERVFEDFDYEAYAYCFLLNHKKLPNFTMIDRDQDAPREVVDKALKLLEEDRTLFSRLIRKNHKAEIEFLQSAK